MKSKKARYCLARADMQNGISASPEQELTKTEHPASAGINVNRISRQCRKERKRDYFAKVGSDEKLGQAKALPLRVRDSVWPGNAVSLRKGSGFWKGGLFLVRAVRPNGMEVGCSDDDCTCGVVGISLQTALEDNHDFAKDNIVEIAIADTP